MRTKRACWFFEVHQLAPPGSPYWYFSPFFVQIFFSHWAYFFYFTKINNPIPLCFVAVQSLSHVQLSAACQAFLSFTISQELDQIHIHWISDAIQPPHPVIPFSSCPQSFPTIGSFLMSQFFTSGGQSISFSFNISPSSEHPGLISFRIDWLDLLAVQGTLKSLLQQHNSKTSILLESAFFNVQLSHPHMTSGKIIAPTYREIL